MIEREGNASDSVLRRMVEEALADARPTVPSELVFSRLRFLHSKLTEATSADRETGSAAALALSAHTIEAAPDPIDDELMAGLDAILAEPPPNPDF